MCGIAGCLTTHDADAVGTGLRRMARAIAHRGPDDEGFFEATLRDGRHRIGLAHRRLSIIDLSTGHQPMQAEGGRLQIVFNGEIYNFRALRDELAALGHAFVTASDTEVVLHAWREWGCECVPRLHGMFAFALWDAQREQLFLARDRFGKKPLFLLERPGRLLFASEIKALMAWPGVRPEVDSGALCDYFVHRYVPAPRTLFAGVRKLMPGCWALWERGTLVERAYWQAPDAQALPLAPGPPADPPADPVSGFAARLEDAVAARMVSDVPFGAFLSGGIDSSAVVGLMSRHSALPVKTFSVGFAEARYSELDHARAVAVHFGTEHHELLVSQADLIGELPALTRFRDAPVAEPSDIPIYMLAREARKTVKMVLTGEGADEVLAGYPKHMFEGLTPAYHRLPRALRHGVIEPLVASLPYAFHRAKTAAQTLAIEDFDERMPRWFGAMSVATRERLLRRPAGAGAPPSSSPPPLGSRSSAQASALRRVLFFDQTSWLPDNLLERGDRMTMAASVEARMPFLDHRLADYVSALPDRLRLRGRTTKWILRQAVAGLLPPEVLARRKVGFRVPVNLWFRGPLLGHLREHLEGETSLSRVYYERRELRRLIDEHASGRHNHEKLLWCLLALEVWHRECLPPAMTDAPPALICSAPETRP